MHESFGTLVENIGQIADSGQSVELWRSVEDTMKVRSILSPFHVI